MGNGEFRYAYPKVQYKVIDNTPMLIGLSEGAELLPMLFLSIKELNIGGSKIPVHQKNIESKKVKIGVKSEPEIYTFKTLWMALNQKNHAKYENANPFERDELLQKILVGNVLSFFKGMDLFVDSKIEATCKLTQKMTGFKGNKMRAFDGMVQTNARLPDYIGVGKQVSRGFGTIKKVP
jgi:hypothetical protein